MKTLYESIMDTDIDIIENTKFELIVYKILKGQELSSIESNLLQSQKAVYKVSNSDIKEIVRKSIKVLGPNCSLNWIDTSRVTDMSELFEELSQFNGNISDWDVSNVEKMSWMFGNCKKFNQPLNNWNVSKVKYMNFMFCGCINFNQPLNNWDVSKVEYMNFMFYGCRRFNQPLNNWDVSKVKNDDDIFKYCPIKKEYKP